MQNLGIDVLLNSQNLLRLLGGLFVTIKVAFVSILLSFLFGALFGLLRTRHNRILIVFFRFYLELFRIIPLLVWLYVLYYLLPSYSNFNISAYTVALIIFTLWGSAEMSDIVRGAIISLPRHQSESASALGLKTWQIYLYILVPQSLKLAMPAAVNLAARIIMTTSLLFIIGVVEFIKVGQQIIELNYLANPYASFWIYSFIFITYFIVCYPLSKLANHLSQEQTA